MSGQVYDEIRLLNSQAIESTLHGEYERALRLAAHAYELGRTHFGESHADTLRLLCNLARAQTHFGDLDAARRAYEEVLRLGQLTLDPTDPLLVDCHNDLAGTY